MHDHSKLPLKKFVQVSSAEAAAASALREPQNHQYTRTSGHPDLVALLAERYPSTLRAESLFSSLSISEKCIVNSLEKNSVPRPKNADAFRYFKLSIASSLVRLKHHCFSLSLLMHRT